MGLFSRLFGTHTSHDSALVIDISAESVGGAFIEYKDGVKPIVHYTLRVPIEVRTEEPHEKALMRTLSAFGTTCIQEGAPILMRATGRGSVEGIFVSIDAPWQELQVRTEHVKRDETFEFTKRFVTELLDHTRPPLSARLMVDESIIGTILNGYETHDPYGKTVYRASIVILTSLIDERIAKGIATILRTLFHTKHLYLIAGASLRYQGLRTVFPHEQNALVLDVTNTLTSIALVRRGMLVALTEIPSTVDNPTWVPTVTDELKKLSERYPLPRTIFLLSRVSDNEILQKALNDAHLGALWLSEHPPHIVSVAAGHLTEHIQQAPEIIPDLILFLMAIQYQHHVRGIAL